MGAFKDIIEDKDVTPDTSKSTDTIKRKREADAMLTLKELMEKKGKDVDPSMVAELARMRRRLQAI